MTDINVLEMTAMAACSRSGVPQHGNCADYNAQSEYSKDYWMIVVVKIVKVTIAVEAKVSKQVNLHIAKIANESRGVGMGH